MSKAAATARSARPGVALMLLAFCCGCGEPAPVTVRVAVVGPEGPCTGARPPLAIGDLGAATLRISVLGRNGVDAAPELVCDEVVELTRQEGSADLRLVLGAAPIVDLLVEAFDGSQPPRLVAAGSANGLNRAPRLQPLRALLAPAARFGCAPGALQTARAFHSATLLPNGEILVVGGVTDASPTGAPVGGEFWLTGTVEVYDPGTGTFRTAAGEIPAGRAFHTAIPLAAPGVNGPFDLLLVGGLAASASAVGPALRVGTADDPLPLVPGEGATAAPSVVLRYYPWSDPPRVAILSGSPALARRALHAAGTAGGRTVIAGGLADDASGLGAPAPDFEILPSAGSSVHVGPFGLLHPRVGGVAGPLAADALLVFGGNLASADAAAVVAEAAEVLTLGETPAAVPATFEAGSAGLVTSVAHATLTPTATGLLLVGGLRVTPGAARSNLQAPLAFHLTRVGEAIRIDEVPADGLTPLAYHAAAPLDGGDVLVVGGGTTDCADTVLCPGDGVSRYSTTTSSLTRASWLVRARLGHSLTLRADGSVVVAGGLGLEGGSLAALADVEVHVPGSPEGKPDRFGRGPGQASGRRCQR